jgi:MEMO1 family protein
VPVESRPPAVSGAFYPADGSALAHAIESCFTDPRGPGGLPVRRRSATRRLAAAVVPHAGYRYSGAVAAHVYARIAAERPPRSVLVLGVDHHGASRSPATSLRPWRTPLGPTPVDVELARRCASGPIRVDEAAHAREHSIEVQLPFLEYVLPKPAFVPVQVPFGPYEQLEKVASELRAAVEGRDVLCLASTDFSHYVPVEEAQRLDRLAIDAILAGDPRALYDVVEENGITMCGIAPTTVLLQMLHPRSQDVTLLRWGHSGEVEPMAEVVGYAAIAVEGADPDPPPVK